MYRWRLEPTDKLPAGKKMTVGELVARYGSTKTGVRTTTKQGDNFVQKLLKQTEFSGRKIGNIRTSDAKIYLIKRQEVQYSQNREGRSEHRFNHMVARYNEIFRIQLPNITPHVCRHTYCSNMARSGMRREASPCRETPKRSSTSWGTAKSA